MNVTEYTPNATASPELDELELRLIGERIEQTIQRDNDKGAVKLRPLSGVVELEPTGAVERVVIICEKLVPMTGYEHLRYSTHVWYPGDGTVPGIYHGRYDMTIEEALSSARRRIDNEE